MMRLNPTEMSCSTRDSTHLASSTIVRPSANTSVGGSYCKTFVKKLTSLVLHDVREWWEMWNIRRTQWTLQLQQWCRRNQNFHSRRKSWSVHRRLERRCWYRLQLDLCDWKEHYCSIIRRCWQVQAQKSRASCGGHSISVCFKSSSVLKDLWPRETSACSSGWGSCDKWIKLSHRLNKRNEHTRAIWVWICSSLIGQRAQSP